MSVEAMTMVTVSGPENMVNTAIQSLVINRDFHPENAVTALSAMKKLLPFDASNPYSEPLNAALGIAHSLEIKPDYSDFSHEELSISSVSDYLSKLSSRISLIRSERDEMLATMRNDKIVVEQLSHFASFDVELSRLFTMKYLKFRFGRIPADTYKDCMIKINARPDVYYIPSGTTEPWVYGAYFSLPSEYSRVDSIFASMGFERIHIVFDGNTESTANEVLERMRSDAAQAEERIKVLDASLKELKEQELQRLLLSYSWLRFMSDAYAIRSYGGYRNGKFYLVGWIPSSQAETYVKECESFEGFGCILTDARDSRDARPPVKLKKGFFSNIYEPFVEMYGLPAYGELDPRLFMAITYTLLFGIMFGDVGQGVCLLVIGFLLWKLKGMWLGRIVALCGVSASAFGFVYGSVFGNEHLLPGFKVLEDGNTMKILIVAVGVGVGLILICMILNIITGIRQRDIKKIFFSPNGLAGFVLYLGIAFGVVMQVLKGVSVFSSFYILGVVILPLFLIFAAGPLTKLLTGQKDWLPKSFGMFIVEGFFELFETLLSYVSNTVSFLRVGAFAISHAGMMMVVYLLTASADGGNNLAGLIFGNLLVTGLETVLVCIQVMRLEFYEMFGRFYESGGVKFAPKTINYAAAEK
ncbi:MAG: V-type ATPase 116kDa subunit family protein [Oscillospiraceae bacterium]